MSISALLVPIAVAVIATAHASKEDIKSYCKQTEKSRQPIPSRYADNRMLKKTLIEHGASVQEQSENRIKASFAEGSLTYVRNTPDEAFGILIDSINCVDEFMEELDQIFDEYCCNVQSYTYERVKENLPEEMTIEKEEVLDDNSILITLTVD